MSGQAPQLAPGAGEHPYGGRGPLLMGIAWTGWIIATTLVGLRLYVRLKMEREAGKWALWWAMIALVRDRNTDTVTATDVVRFVLLLQSACYLSLSTLVLAIIRTSCFFHNLPKQSNINGPLMLSLHSLRGFRNFPLLHFFLRFKLRRTTSWAQLFSGSWESLMFVKTDYSPIS